MGGTASPGYEPVRHWRTRRWPVAAGVAMLALGIAGLFMTVSFTIASVRWYGVLLIVAGAVQLLEAFTGSGGLRETCSSRVIRIGIGILYVAGGLYAAFSLEGTAIALTLLLGVMLVASGLVRVVWAFAHEARQSRGVLIVLSALSIALGIAIISQWPLSGLWAIGLFLSGDLIASGLSWIWVGFSSGRGSSATIAHHDRH